MISFLREFNEADLAYNCGVVGYEAATASAVRVKAPAPIYAHVVELRGPLSDEVIQKLRARNAARVDALKKSPVDKR